MIFPTIVGFDMAYIFNGYVYHTEYDRVNIISKQSLQNTGDNVLALAKGVANAPEMDNPEVSVGVQFIFVLNCGATVAILHRIMPKDTSYSMIFSDGLWYSTPRPRGSLSTRWSAA